MSGLTGYLVLGCVLIAGIVLFAAAMVMRQLLAPRAVEPAGLTTYESGVDPVGSGWAQVNVRYLSYAFLYVIFAVDAVYLFPWALVLRDHHLGRTTLIEVAVFVAIVLVGLVHAGRRGLLTWEDDA